MVSFNLHTNPKAHVSGEEAEAQSSSIASSPPAKRGGKRLSDHSYLLPSPGQKDFRGRWKPLYPAIYRSNEYLLIIVLRILFHQKTVSIILCPEEFFQGFRAYILKHFLKWVTGTLLSTLGNSNRLHNASRRACTLPTHISSLKLGYE